MNAPIFHPEADAEMLQAARYYESKAKGLGFEFLDDVQNAVDRIALEPEVWPLLCGATRRFLLRRFPYGILYEMHAGRIWIMAVMHLRRKPGYWRARRPAG